MREEYANAARVNVNIAEAYLGKNDLQGVVAAEGREAKKEGGRRREEKDG